MPSISPGAATPASSAAVGTGTGSTGWAAVSSARTDGLSISIHVYGADIGQVRRHRLDDTGAVVEFVSGYDSEPTC